MIIYMAGYAFHPNDYVPDTGIGAILKRKDIQTLSYRPVIKFLQHDQEKQNMYNMYSSMETESFVFPTGYIEDGANCIFSVLLDRYDLIPYDQYIHIPFRRTQTVSEEITLYCKLDPEKKKNKITHKEDPNGSSKTFTPIILPGILVDPFTEALFHDCSIGFVPSPSSLYKVMCIRVLEDVETVEKEETVQSRISALQNFNKLKESTQK